MQSWYSDVQNRWADRKDRDQFCRKSQKDHSPEYHDHVGGHDRVFERIADPFVVLCTIIKADDGDDHLLQSHQRNKEKGLQLVINAQDGNSVFCELFEDQIQTDDIKGIK